MARDPEWHAEYLRLENAKEAARGAWQVARTALERAQRPRSKAPAARVAALAEACEAALGAFREASAALFDFEIRDVVIVDIARLPAREWLAALRA